jgi:hypothetical protein
MQNGQGFSTLLVSKDATKQNLKLAPLCLGAVCNHEHPEFCHDFYGTLYASAKNVFYRFPEHRS